MYESNRADMVGGKYLVYFKDFFHSLFFHGTIEWPPARLGVIVCKVLVKDRSCHTLTAVVTFVHFLYNRTHRRLVMIAYKST